MSENQILQSLEAVRLQEPVVSRTVFMSFPGESNLAGTLRGGVWNYMVKRFEIDQRDLGHVVAAKYSGRPPEPSGLMFAEFPEDTSHHWGVDRVNGLVIPSLRSFVDGVNQALDLANAPAEKDKVKRRMLGYNVGIVFLKHMDEAADYFLNQE